MRFKIQAISFILCVCVCSVYSLPWQIFPLPVAPSGAPKAAHASTHQQSTVVATTTAPVHVTQQPIEPWKRISGLTAGLLPGAVPTKEPEEALELLETAEGQIRRKIGRPAKDLLPPKTEVPKSA